MKDCSVENTPGRFTTLVDQTSEAEWNRLLGDFSDASFYQTWAYGAVSWGEAQLSHLVLMHQGKAAALAQLRLVRFPLVARGIAYLRWGPVCTRREEGWSEEVFRVMTEALVQEYAGRRRLLLRIIPRPYREDSVSETILKIWGDRGLRLESGFKPYRTLRVDLRAEPAVLRKQLDQKWRNQLNGAERNGLMIAEGSSDELYAQFLDLYREMMARKQFETSVNVEQFRRIQQRLPDGHKMLILISHKDGRPMTGLVGSVVGDTGIYLLGATSSEGMKTKGSYLLQWQMMQRLKERGCLWYDLGGINQERNPGVYHFKQGMGGKEVGEMGRFCVSGSVLSAASVAAAEQLSNCLATLKRRIRKQPQAALPGAAGKPAAT